MKNKKQRIFLLLLLTIYVISTFVACRPIIDLYSAYQETQKILPESGRWECKEIGFVIDFDKGVVEIDGIVANGIASDYPNNILVGTQDGKREIYGDCIEANDDSFCIKDYETGDEWWFFRVE